MSTVCAIKDYPKKKELVRVRTRDRIDGTIRSAAGHESSERIQLLPRISLVKVGVVSFILIGLHNLHMARALYRVAGTEFDPVVYYSGGVFFSIALLLLIQKIAQRFLRTRVFTQQEFVLLIISTTTGMLLGGAGILHYGVSMLFGFPISIGTVRRGELVEWTQRPSLFGWQVFPDDSKVLDALMRGGSVPWLAWLPTMLAFTLYFVLIYWVFLCLSVMVRRRWTDVEHFQYPLIEPPLAMVGVQKGLVMDVSVVQSIWRSWPGRFGMLVGVIHLLSQELPYLFPGFPYLYQWQVTIISKAPYTLGATISPIPMAIAYLIVNIWILFSVWFTWLVTQWGFQILVNALGYANVGEFAQGGFGRYRDAQIIGASLAIVGLSFYIARQELREIVRAAYNKGAKVDDSNEPLPYKLAFWGGLIGFIGLVAYAWIVFRISPLFTALWGIIFMASALGVARMRAQGGFFQNTIDIYNPVKVIFAHTGNTGLFGGSTYVFGTTFMAPMGLGSFQSLIGFALEGFKMGDSVKLHRRIVSATLVLTVTISILLSMWGAIVTIHGHGGIAAVGGHAQYNANLISRSYIRSPKLDQVIGMKDKLQPVFVVAGALFTLVLGYLSTAFAWWPIHPLGYLASVSINPNIWFWFSFFIAWFIKTLVMRWGGLRIERTLARPFMVGIILGFSVLKGIIVVLAALLGWGAGWYV